MLCFVSERKAGLGADFLGKFFELLLVMDWVIVLALYFSSLANSSTAKYTFAIKESKQVHLAAIAVGSSRVALV